MLYNKTLVYAKRVFRFDERLFASPERLVSNKSPLAKLSGTNENGRRMKLVTRIRRSLPLLPVVFVLGFSLVYALAWIQLYLQPHPYNAASVWIFDNLPQGSLISGPHWDDRLPISIPGKNAPGYFVMEGRDNELPFYERDTSEKLNLVLKRMAKSDYIIFPTPRTPDSIPRVPEEFFYTAPLLQLLFAERLGFTLEKTVKDRPTFLGFTFNDDLADESFSVYDHPKVVIFKNVEKLPVEELRERVLQADKYEPLPTLNDILLMDAGGWAKTAQKSDPLAFYALGSLVVLLAMTVGFWSLLGGRLTKLPDQGLGLSVLGGVALCAGLTWILVSLSVVPFTRSACVLSVAIVLIAGLIRFVSHADLRRRFFSTLRRHGLYALLAIVAGCVVVIATKHLYPDYYWGRGEQQSFYLSYFVRTDSLPSLAEWGATGGGMVSYVAHFLTGWIVKLVGAIGSFGYEICFVLLGGVVGGMLYSVLVTVIRKPLFSLFFVCVGLIPCIRGLHAWHNGYSAVSVAEAAVNTSSPKGELVTWLFKNVRGAPTVIESCIGTPAGSVALATGLPSVKPVDGAVEGSEVAKRNESIRAACSLQDPQGVFSAMMRLGGGLLIVDGDSAAQPGRQEAVARLTERTDLFAKVYDQSGWVVFAPSFSDYFPRSYQKAGKPNQQ